MQATVASVRHRGTQPRTATRYSTAGAFSACVPVGFGFAVLHRHGGMFCYAAPINSFQVIFARGEGGGGYTPSHLNAVVKMGVYSIYAPYRSVFMCSMAVGSVHESSRRSARQSSSGRGGSNVCAQTVLIGRSAPYLINYLPWLECRRGGGRGGVCSPFDNVAALLSTMPYSRP